MALVRCGLITLVNEQWLWFDAVSHSDIVARARLLNIRSSADAIQFKVVRPLELGLVQMNHMRDAEAIRRHRVVITTSLLQLRPT